MGTKAKNIEINSTVGNIGIKAVAGSVDISSANEVNVTGSQVNLGTPTLPIANLNINAGVIGIKATSITRNVTDKDTTIANRIEHL